MGLRATTTHRLAHCPIAPSLDLFLVARTLVSLRDVRCDVWIVIRGPSIVLGARMVGKPKQQGGAVDSSVVVGSRARVAAWHSARCRQHQVFVVDICW